MGKHTLPYSCLVFKKSLIAYTGTTSPQHAQRRTDMPSHIRDSTTPLQLQASESMCFIKLFLICSFSNRVNGSKLLDMDANYVIQRFSGFKKVGGLCLLSKKEKIASNVTIAKWRGRETRH